MVVPLQTGLQRPQNGKGGFLSRFLHHHRAEPALQSRILFNIPAVFLPGGGPQHLQLSPAQSGLEDIGGVDGPLRRTGAHNGVHLVHKEDHVPTALYLRQHIPQPLFKFSPVFGACHQACHIEAYQPFVLELGRHISQGHPLGQPLGNGGLTHPRFSYQSRIILVLPAEDPHHHVDLPVPSDHRLHTGCLLYQILAELFQKLRSNRLLFYRGRSPLLPAQIVHRMGKQRIGADAVYFQQLPGCALLLPGK